MHPIRQTHSHALSGPAKNLLLGLVGLFAGAALLLVISASTAAPATGRAPDLAITLASETNTGILAPGEQRWFRLTPRATGERSNQVDQALTLFFTPGEGMIPGQVSLQLFEEREISNFDQGQTGRMTNFGAGQIVSRDNDPFTGELLWRGWLFDRQSYYIQLVNGNDLPIDYWLLTADVPAYSLTPAEAEPPAPPQAAPSQLLAGPSQLLAGPSQLLAGPSQLLAGTSPQSAWPLLTGRNQGRLQPGQSVWYSFSRADPAPEFFAEMALTLFATPNTRQQINDLSLELFTAEAVQAWTPAGAAPNNFGAGSLASRDSDPLTGERFWTGWVSRGGLYYIRLKNGADEPLDYYLFSGDIYNPQLGPQ